MEILYFWKKQVNYTNYSHMVKSKELYLLQFIFPTRVYEAGGKQIWAIEWSCRLRLQGCTFLSCRTLLKGHVNISTFYYGEYYDHYSRFCNIKSFEQLLQYAQFSSKVSKFISDDS